jgi:hypothetical protein
MAGRGLRVRATLGGLILTLAAGRTVVAGTGDAPPALSKPVSPGSIALLVEHTARDDVRERLAHTLGDRRPAVRAAAARVLHAAGQEAGPTAWRAVLEVARQDDRDLAPAD